MVSYTPNPSEKGSTVKGKNLGSKFFLFRADSFSEGRQNNFERVVSLEWYPFPLSIMCVCRSHSKSSLFLLDENRRMFSYFVVSIFPYFSIWASIFIPTLFRKRVGDIVIASVRLSVCPLCYLLPKRWTESNQIWWLACLHKWGMQEHVYFWPRPQGPWGGVKRSNINNFQFQSQF